MKLFERIGRKTPKKNKVIGITTTLLATASLVVAESGLVDNRPILKMGLELLSAKLGAISVYQAQKVEDNGQVNY